MRFFRRKVQKGTGTGQKIGFPTLNFNAGNFDQFYREGVYACEVRFAQKSYRGALFFGSRMNCRGKTLEIHVMGFHRKIYGQFVNFRILKNIRAPKKFGNLEELKKQIQKDVQRLNLCFDPFF